MTESQPSEGRADVGGGGGTRRVEASWQCMKLTHELYIPRSTERPLAELQLYHHHLRCAVTQRRYLPVRLPLPCPSSFMLKIYTDLSSLVSQLAP